MKYCHQCGTQNEDNAAFCKKCGAQSKPVVPKPAVPAPEVSVQKPAEVPAQQPAPKAEVQPAPAPQQKQGNPQQPAPEIPEEPKKKAGKGMIIGIAIVVLLVAIAGVAGFLFLRWYNSPEQEALRELNAGNLEGAAELLEDDKSLADSEEFAAALKARIETIKKEFTDGSKEYTQVLVDFDTIEAMEVESVAETLTAAREYAKSLNDSRASFSTGETFFSKGNYLEALEQYQQVIEADGNYAAAQTKQTECVNSYRDQMLAQAQTYAAEGNYDSAVEVIKVALGNLTDDATLKEQLALYQKSGAEKEKADALAKAKEQAEQGDLDAALKTLADYTALHGEDADVSVAVGEYTKQRLDAILADADALVGEEKFEEALKLIDEAAAVSDDSRIDVKRKEYEKSYGDSVVAKVDTMMTQEKYQEARQLLTTAIASLPQNSVLPQKLSAVDTAYGESAVTKAKALLAEGKYEQAKQMVNDALKALPDNDALAQLAKDVESSKPVYLHTLTPQNGSFAWNEGDPADPFENTYSGLQNYAIFHGKWTYHDGAETYSVEYKIDEKYDCLNLNVTPYSDFGSGAGSYFQVYVNGNHRYTSPWIGQKTEPFSIPTVDISDAIYLKIIVYVGGNGCLMLSDVALSNPVGFESKLVSEYTPLHGLNTFNGSLPWHNGYPEDSLDNDYSTVWNYVGLHGKWTYHDGAETYSAEYYVNSKYKAISMDIAPASDFGAGGSSVVKIYIDDTLAYTSETIGQKTQRFNTGEIDLSGATYVKVVVEVQGNGCTLLSNVLLKNLE